MKKKWKPLTVTIIISITLVSAPVFAREFFDEDQKQIISAAFAHFGDELKERGIFGVKSDIIECYDTAYKKGLHEALFYCIALDTQATVQDTIHAQMFKSKPEPYFENDTYDARVRKNLAKADITNPYAQTTMIQAMKQELNHVAGQFIRRKEGVLSPEEQDAIIQEEIVRSKAR